MIAKRKPEPPVTAASPSTDEHPVREYVAAMSAELSSLAWKDGDGLLAQILDAAAQLARRPA